MRGVQRGEIPWLWVSNRGEKHPCWHTILLAKSSVLYLLRPLTLKRDSPTSDRPFSVAAEQADFVGCKIHKTKDLPRAKSGCSGVVGAGYLVAVRKDLLCQRGRKRYIKTRRSDTLSFPRLRGAQELVWQAAGTVLKYSRPL